MRVSDNTNFATVRDSIARTRSRLEDLQTQTATLKKLNKPSDDPVGAAKVLEVRTDKVNNEQFHSNAKLAEAFLNNTDHALEQFTDIIIRAKEIAINQSSNASSTPESRLGVSEEISQLYQQAVSTANRRIGDRYIFGGYKNTTPPVDSEGNYHGDMGEQMAEIGRELYIGTNLPGLHVFNTQPEASGDFKRLNQQQNQMMEPGKDKEQPAEINRTMASVASVENNDLGGADAQNVNLFQELKTLRVGLLTGDIDAIRGTLEHFDDLLGNMSANRAKIGSRIQGMQGNISALERHNITNAQLTSAIEDADMTQVVSDMAKEETVFKSSLASSKHLIQPTLLDFLR